MELMSQSRFEPLTPRLSSEYSTIELQAHPPNDKKFWDNYVLQK